VFVPAEHAAAGRGAMTPVVPVETPALPDSATPAIPVGLNPRYTFDSFMVGLSNQFANAAFTAAALDRRS
jgi:chromosomal replication initiation ATPase DnaA